MFRCAEIPFYAFFPLIPIAAAGEGARFVAMPGEVSIDFPGGAERLAGVIRLRAPAQGAQKVRFRAFESDSGKLLYRSPEFTSGEDIPVAA